MCDVCLAVDWNARFGEGPAGCKASSVAHSQPRRSAKCLDSTPLGCRSFASVVVVGNSFDKHWLTVDVAALAEDVDFPPLPLAVRGRGCSCYYHRRLLPSPSSNDA